MQKDVAKQELPARIEELLGKELVAVEEIFRTELQSDNPCVNDVYTHVSCFRGKRLRPMLLLLSGAAAGKLEDAHNILAAVVEMIHTATLVHDDVLDEAETRRHVATVNNRWNNETSVLFGDFLFTHAFHLASSLETTLACRLIGRSTNLVCEGELSQIQERGNLDLSEETYFRIIDGKTAELCALCGYLGAHYAGASEEIAKSLEQYGRSLGIAFQIADDLLDILGSEQEMGKTLGSDFAKQKLTLPLIRFLNTADESTSVKVRELLSHPSEQSWSKVLPYLQQSDAVEYTRQRALEFTEQARRSLDCLPDTPAKRILEELTDFAIQRNC